MQWDIEPSPFLSRLEVIENCNQIKMRKPINHLSEKK